MNKISIIGIILTKIKNNNFLSLKLTLNLNFLTSNLKSTKKGINRPICFNKKIIGNIILNYVQINK